MTLEDKSFGLYERINKAIEESGLPIADRFSATSYALVQITKELRERGMDDQQVEMLVKHIVDASEIEVRN